MAQYDWTECLASRWPGAARDSLILISSPDTAGCVASVCWYFEQTATPGWRPFREDVVIKRTVSHFWLLETHAATCAQKRAIFLKMSWTGVFGRSSVSTIHQRITENMGHALAQPVHECWVLRRCGIDYDRTLLINSVGLNCVDHVQWSSKSNKLIRP